MAAEVVLEIEGNNETQRMFEEVYQSLERLNTQADRFNRGLGQNTSQSQREYNRLANSLSGASIATNRFASATENADDEILKIRASTNLLNRTILDQRKALASATAEEQKAIRQQIAAITTQKQDLALQREDIRIQQARAKEHERLSDVIRRTAREQSSAIDRTNAALRRYGTGLSNVERLWFALGGVSALIRVGRGILDAAVEVDTLRRTLVTLTGSVTEANRQLEVFKNLARSPGISFAGAAESAIHFQNANLNIRESIALMEQLGNIAALSGQTLRDVSFNISQLVTAGQFNQRDLREALGRIPLLARALGTTAAEEVNRALLASGQSVAQFITERLAALPRAAADSAANTFQNFSIAIRQLSASIGELALPALTRDIRTLTAYIQNNTEDIVQRFKRGIQFLTTAVHRLIQNLRSLGNVLKGVLFVQGFSSMANITATLGNTLGQVSARIRESGSSFAILRTHLSGATLAMSGFFRTVSALSAIGLGVSAAFLAYDFAKFIIGMSRSTDATNEVADAQNKLREALDKTTASFSTQISEINKLTRTQTEAELLEIPNQLTELRREFEGLFNFRYSDITRQPIDQRIAELGISNRTINNVGRFISALKERRNELREELRNLGEGAGTQGAQRRFAARTENIRTDISEIDNLLRAFQGVIQRRELLTRRLQAIGADVGIDVGTAGQTQAARNYALELLNAGENVSRLQDKLRGYTFANLELLRTISETITAIRERDAIALAQIDAEIAAQQKIADNQNTSNKNREQANQILNELAVERRRVEIQTQKDVTAALQTETRLRTATLKSQNDAEISFAQSAQNRQRAIYADRGRQAQTITRTAIAALRAAEQLNIDGTRAYYESLRSITRTHQRENERAQRSIREQLNIMTGVLLRYAARLQGVYHQIGSSLQLPQGFFERAQRVVKRLNQQREQDNREVTDRLKQQEEDLYNIRLSLNNQLRDHLIDSGFQLIFNRDASFKEIALSFIRQSLRIILQNHFETQAIIRNNERIIASNQKVGASRARAFLGGGGASGGGGIIGGIDFGGIASFLSGGAGALGVSAALFPTEFRNLGTEARNTFDDTASGLLDNTGNIIVEGADILLSLPGSIIRKIGETQTRLIGANRAVRER